MNFTEQISIDASIREGGGQIFRNSMSLSVILKKDLVIHSIRSNRPTPGLHNQALAVIRVIQSIFGGKAADAELGSTSFMYQPTAGLMKEGNTGVKLVSSSAAACRRFVEDVGSAGSLTLVLQALLPCVLLCEGCCEKVSGATDITLIGGTNVSFSPPVEHFLNVLLPVLSKMGITVGAHLVKRGFFPRGGGKIQLTEAYVSPPGISPISLTQQGEFTSGRIFVYASPEDMRDLDGFEAQGLLYAAIKTLQHSLESSVRELLSTHGCVAEDFTICCDAVSDVDNCGTSVKSGNLKTSYTNSQVDEQGDKSNKRKQTEFHGKHKNHKHKKPNKVAITLGALVCLYTTTGCVISADAIVSERDHKKFDEAKSLSTTTGILNTVMSRLARSVCSGACVDEQTADQLLIYMALAPGTSEILCAPLCEEDHSQHIEAAFEVVSQFTNRRFTMDIHEETKCRLIRCDSA
mmetsp:Transcript_24720/g.41800  ORF Transcript_24720/g.41800 Transcript_24720/m.41800 type:complete len:463 (-) Transcript_24720:54-1442(-)